MTKQSMQAFWQQLQRALSSMGEQDAKELIRLADRLCDALEGNAQPEPNMVQDG